MNSIKLDFESLVPNAVEALIHVHGEEYRDIIEDRLYNSIYISYREIDGIRDYVRCLRIFKRREYHIRFLEEIGMDVEKYKRDNYTEPLPNEINRIIDAIISEDFAFSNVADDHCPIRAFDENNENKPERLLSNKLKIINYLLNNQSNVITKDNYEEFIKTDKYQELLIIINKYLEAYQKVYKEYKEWENTELKPYFDYIESEEKRREKILLNKKVELLKDIYEYLPLPVINAIKDKTIEEQVSTIIGNGDLSIHANIEFLTHQTIGTLLSPDIRAIDKYIPTRFQLTLLKNMGITAVDDVAVGCKSQDDYIEYVSLVRQNNLMDYFLTDEQASAIQKNKEQKYEETKKEYIITSQDYLDAIHRFHDSEDTRKYMHRNMSSKHSHIPLKGCYTDSGDFFSIMFYIFTEFSVGRLLFMFIHECGHIVTQTRDGVGLELNSINDEDDKNPYNKKNRKYERMNEAINDIFTLEAIDYFHSRGQYLIEPKEFTIEDASDCNTPAIVKDLLRPLINKYKKPLMNSLFNVNIKLLTNCIGEENYEELNDAINKVDYIISQGLTNKQIKDSDGPLAEEYQRQIERIEQLYVNMDKHYADYLNRTSSTNTNSEGNHKKQ